ncbi:hypothetical protein KFZ70_14510 [Tamlana fucoidanivorans]|uniref:Uncharacterized protein n=1 Tax=Allotamlana fucoidanivorans TaxID=2583814 RepID=A0A5C4SFS6_9FLAO|nr:hypothetical protein [Tamlana fucoidanivorans]TNJ42391.1 hypothetical protein FGF67_14045 [Tamlana fucoidanivorans]
MKNIKFLTLFFCLLAVLGCEEEYAEYNPPQDNFEDISWLVGLNPNVGADTQFSINAETQISFFNLAQGANSSKWIIEEGNKFLKEGFKTNDSLPLFIDPNLGTTSTNGKAYVLFRNAGDNKVTLINTFDTPVTSNMSDTYKDHVIESITEENGVYTYQVDFLFDVYALLNPAFSVLKDDVEILNVTEDDMPSLEDEANWPVVEIEAATSLTFVDNSVVGRPNGGTWFIPDGVPSRVGAAQPANINFYKLGTFNAGTFRSLRAAPLPTSNTEKLIPLKVKVIQSSQPFQFDGVLKEDENEIISFRVNGEVNDFSGAESHFTVNVQNGAFNQDIPVALAKVREDNAIFIELSLAQPIYNSDIITVSYDGNGGLQSADNRTLQAFGPENVAMFFGGNVIPEKAHASFEEPSGAANRAFALNYFTGNGNIIDGPNGLYVYERVEGPNVPVSDGNASMKYSTLASNPIPNVNLWSFGLARIQDIPAGTYKMTYDIFIEPGTTLKTFRTEFNKPEFSRQIWDIENVERGKWVTVENQVVLNADITAADNLRFTFRPHALENVGVTGPQLLYIDNLQFIEIEVRP